MNQDFRKIDLKFAINEIGKFLDRENEIGSMFVEMLKDEINSTEESEIYGQVKKLVLKYNDNENALNIIDEVVEAISGGASMTEVLLVARDEVIEPTPINVMNFETLINKNINNENVDNKIN